AKTIRMDMRANQESINLKGYKLLLNPNLYNNEIDFKELTEILLKNKNTHALMHANEKQKELYNKVINKLKSAVDNFGNEGAADKSLSNLSENTIGAHKKNKTQKAKKHDTYNRVKEVLKERIENLIAEKLFSEMGVLPNGNKLILFNKSLPSAFNKLSAEEKAKLIDELKEYYRNNNALEGMLYWPINTYQLKNSNDEVLQTMTGSFIDKDSEANNLRFRFFLDLIGVTDNEDKRIYFSRLLDTNSEKTKIKKDQETLGLEAKQKRLNLIVRQAHFSEGFWNDKKGSGFNIIEGQDNKNDYTKSISDDLINVYNLIDAKFPLNRENKDNNYYANIGLKNISCEFFELMHNKNLTASQLILLNTLQIILKNKLPKFNVVSIVGCKSAKDRTMVEIVTECALQATIEDAFFNNEETRGLEKPIDLELLVKNNKINASDLTPQLQKTFIDNFDDSILYIANLHDNKLHTNQNARTHFKVLNDFAYHRKFKEPYKEIKAGS
ncbi:MAG TPA: hypothetical protein PKD00_07740, partial [Burkholderiales bacterium]|nr:hypothetical protein [Burkholderiales bacterium]